MWKMWKKKIIGKKYRKIIYIQGWFLDVKKEGTIQENTIEGKTDDKHEQMTREREPIQFYWFFFENLYIYIYI